MKNINKIKQMNAKELSAFLVEFAENIEILNDKYCDECLKTNNGICPNSCADVTTEMVVERWLNGNT